MGSEHTALSPRRLCRPIVHDAVAFGRAGVRGCAFLVAGASGHDCHSLTQRLYGFDARLAIKTKLVSFAD